MKKVYLSIVAILLTVTVFSQITLEHSYNYNHQSTIEDDANTTKKICKLSNGNQYYCYADSNVLYIYNINHTLYKSITLPSISPSGYYFDISYISDKLFNLDNKIECLITIRAFGSPQSFTTKIINEDGLELFSKNNASIHPSSSTTEPGAIFSTNSGTKMILWNTLFNGSYVGVNSFSVYSLPGELVTAIDNNILPANKSYLSNPFPNPANEYAAVFYELPDWKKQGSIIIYDINGKQVQNIRVDGSNEYILFNNINLSNGLYVYSLVVDNEIIDSKRMMVNR